MRMLVQRVTSASVVVDSEVVAEISPAGQGLVALVGITHEDTADVAERMAAKLWKLRILDGDLAAADTGAPILVVSQFTLYANTVKGLRPSWNAAAGASVAEPLFDAVVAALRRLGAEVRTGIFGAHMRLSLVNDGPVTLMIEM